MSFSRKLRGRLVSGWLILDKPVGIGSTEIVSTVKNLFGAQKAGHAGTLDPLASGVLPVAFGNATKTIPYVMRGRKVYEFNITWGEERSTDDIQGKVLYSSQYRPTSKEIKIVLSKYTGIIEQIPPNFSAVKIKGERAYNLARNGIRFDLPSRKTEIFCLKFLKYVNRDTSSFRVECGKGTYIRSLARDIGRDLQCYGYVSDLRRTYVSPFLEEALVPFSSLLSFKEIETQDERLKVLDTYIINVTKALSGLMHFAVSDIQANCIRKGKSILVDGYEDEVFPADAYVTMQGSLVAIGQVNYRKFHPCRVFL
ncbi:tRNA pseudouridine synthase B [Liberibacter crescens BT-1]|uniref:tRNA pseudouridine synthase B n=1 Tax=Liberibacter crescens (strain BT-1) TaxID=1215343 RepID=L0ET83_LIBCB|nr:tRNA pseudouridine(55) synthase TruB [Liberibacter crescens]AGA64025.1 tRNA pseudouridine synthase B [Liberibacter crescens BT-1]AMC12333.1 tRNA pseudouridine synthase B [Liberibacter crescens]